MHGMEVKYEICDRCGQKINKRSRLLAKVRRIKINWTLCGCVDENEYQLCKVCSEDLDKWLYAKRDGRNAGTVTVDELHDYKG